MRLQQYINEDMDKDKMLNLIKKDCNPFLQEKSRCMKRILVREKKTSVETIKRFIRRRDRKPMNMDEDYLIFLDDGFEKAFGWRPRRTGVFTAFSPSVYYEMGYGKPFLFFPIGKYRYIYSNDVHDLFLDDFVKVPVIKRAYKISYNPRLEDKYDFSKSMEEVRDEWIKKSYTNKRLCKAKDTNEITFDCDKYYLVNLDFYEHIIENI